VIFPSIKEDIRYISFKWKNLGTTTWSNIWWL